MDAADRGISVWLGNTRLDCDDLHYCGAIAGLSGPPAAGNLTTPASRHRSKNQTKEFPHRRNPGLHVKHRDPH